MSNPFEPKSGGPVEFEKVAKSRELAIQLYETFPEGRYGALAKTALEEALMWANKGFFHGDN